MKWLFWILLLSSGIFFAVMRLGVPGAVDEHALQAQAPLNADKIHLLSASAVALNIAAGAAQSDHQHRSALRELRHHARQGKHLAESDFWPR